jgi:rhodanese-related sulfurtransferase
MKGMASRRDALGLAAVTLGGLAAAAGEPSPAPVARDLAALAAEIAAGRDHVTPTELAWWIMERRTGLRVIDVRGDDTGDDRAIPTAERVELAAILRTPFARAEIVVLYSQADAHAAQAWVLLRLSGVARVVFFLRGGMDAWSDDVLHASPPQGASPEEAAAFARDEPVRRYFGGVSRHPAMDEPREAAPRRRTC